MSLESRVAGHYSEGGLLAAIEAGLRVLGKDPDTVDMEDLAPVDEFHIGGREATMELERPLELARDATLLDIGCGIGGPARFFASTFGCRVTGLDLTPEFIDVARTLTGRMGLGERARFEVGSALDMPFEDASFDRATLLHVGMNIRDKRTLFAEVFRVLRPGARFGVYDIMRIGENDHGFPVPWASTPEESFVEPLAVYREGLEAAGFQVTHERERHAFAAAFFEGLQARLQDAGGPPPVGLHLHMGAEAARKIANMAGAVDAKVLAPVELVAEKPAV